MGILQFEQRTNNLSFKDATNSGLVCAYLQKTKEEMHVNVIQKIKGKVPGFSVKTVDTTGAGDAFVGSFLVSMAKDMSIFEHCCFTLYGKIHGLVLEEVASS
ncbi:hypothetical protein GBA52_026258 [Prunus armeniaca]|nr:hypothetical protein GBA52_026258 [Prunus armeniaca]